MAASLKLPSTNLSYHNTIHLMASNNLHVLCVNCYAMTAGKGVYGMVCVVTVSELHTQPETEARPGNCFSS